MKFNSGAFISSFLAIVAANIFIMYLTKNKPVSSG